MHAWVLKNSGYNLIFSFFTKIVLDDTGNTRRNDISLGSGYKSLAENIFAFCSLGCPPLPTDTSKINEGDGIEATLKRNAAKWYKNCRD